MKEFYNFNIPDDVFYLYKTVNNTTYNDMYYQIGEITLDEFIHAFDSFCQMIRMNLFTNNRIKEYVNYIMLSYKDQTTKCCIIHEKVCEMSDERYMEVFDEMVKFLKNQIVEINK